MIGYKSFDENLICINKQYEVGQSYHEDDTVLHRKGMHFCIDPLDALHYYSFYDNSKLCLVEADNISDETTADTTRVCKDLKIIKEFTYKEYTKEIFKYHNNKNGIIENVVLNEVHIFSDNNIYNIIENSPTYTVYIYGNNNTILTSRGECVTVYYNMGKNNLIIDINIYTDKFKYFRMVDEKMCYIYGKVFTKKNIKKE